MPSKILLICLSSYAPKGLNLINQYNRQELYSIALWNVKKQASKFNIDICVVDNTIGDLKKDLINKNLLFELESEKIKHKYLINRNSLGDKNKGAGEYDMCLAVIDELKNRIDDYKYIIYYTSRHILYNIEKVINLLDIKRDICISNPSYIYPNKRMVKPAGGNYNDMFFIMSTPYFKKYCDTMDPNNLIINKLNSEKNLFHFVDRERKIGADILEIDNLYLARYDYSINHTHLVSNNKSSYLDFKRVLAVYTGYYTEYSFKNIEKTSVIDTNKVFIEICDSVILNFFLNLCRKKTIYFYSWEYLYDIESVWKRIETKLFKNKPQEIVFPIDMESNIVYKNRSINLKKYYEN